MEGIKGMFGEKAQKKTFGRIFSLLDDSRDNKYSKMTLGWKSLSMAESSYLERLLFPSNWVAMRFV